MAGFPPRSWGRPRVELFAVEPRAVQVTWAGLAPGPLRVTVAHHDHTVDTDGGPGGIVVDGLAPGVEHAIRLRGRDVDRVLVARTPHPPAGEELYRIATVSDVHIGLDHFGLSRQMRERTTPEVPHAELCAAAALDELVGWGAQYLVVKGDLVERSRPHEWDTADRLLAATGLPTALVPGNHEVKPDRPMNAPSPLPLSGVEIVTGVAHHDLPGVRLVLVNSTVEGRGYGAVDHLLDDLGDTVGGTELPALVAMHQHPQRFHLPWFLPPGIPGGEARRLLSVLERANQRVVVTSGHTHRNRVRHLRGMTVTEVGSTKDFPGVWAGYTVYEGGITQTVRRTLAPDAMRWTEYTRRAVLGVWGRWSIGNLDDRCVVVAW